MLLGLTCDTYVHPFLASSVFSPCGGESYCLQSRLVSWLQGLVVLSPSQCLHLFVIKKERLHSPALYLFWYSTAWHRATGPEFSAISLWGACRHPLDQGLPSRIHCQVQWEETAALPASVSAHISVAPTCPWYSQAVSKHLWVVIAPLCLDLMSWWCS